MVDDDGPGIAPADRKRVIERGVRTHEHVPGHGLGLAIVRDAVILYGGALLHRRFGRARRCARRAAASGPRDRGLGRDLELDPLRQRQGRAPVDGVRLTAHVRLPGIGAGLAAAAGVLLAAEGTSDLGA